MTDTQQIDYAAEFGQLAKEFSQLAEQSKRMAGQETSQTPQGSEEWATVDVGHHLLQKQSINDQLSAFRECVKRAEAACIAAHSAGVLVEVEGLTELVAVKELGEWGGLLDNDGNLFALLVGGPQFELIGSTDQLFCKQNDGPPFDYRPASLSSAERLSLSTTGLYLPSPGQCERYRGACDSLQMHAKDSSALDHNISPRAMTAHELHEYVCQVRPGESLTDDEAYVVLHEAYARSAVMADRFGKLPACDSWKRYLREYRQATGSQKNKPRTLQPTRSIVDPEKHL